MAPGQPNGQGQGGGKGLGQKDGTRVKGQWGGVGTWVKGGQGLGSRGARAWVRGDSEITQKYS